MGALDGLRVIEVGGATGAYAGKLLADLGADVLKVEPPGGDPARQVPPLRRNEPGQSLRFRYFNAGKRSVTLNLASESGRRLFLRLAAGDDAVIDSTPPDSLTGAGYAECSAANPGLIWVAITPFGLTGPRRHWQGSDLTAQATGGLMAVLGRPEGPPVPLAGEQAYVMASLYGACLATIALYARRRHGFGQLIDVSLQEAANAFCTLMNVPKYRDDGIVPNRAGDADTAGYPEGFYECQDGYIHLLIGRPRHWEVLADWIAEVTGNEDVLNPIFRGPPANRARYKDLLNVYVGEFCACFTREELFAEGQRRHLAFAMVNDAQTLVAHPQLAARGYWQTVPGAEADGPYAGPPYRLSATPARIRGPAAEPGEHSDAVWAALGLSVDEVTRRRAAGVL